MKVFLTGASGILGTDLKLMLEKMNWEVLGFNSKGIDITKYTDVSSKAKDFAPDVIIHSAAMTNVDLCEEDNNAAYLANVIGTHNLSLAANTIGCRIVYISSCGVYGNGKELAHTEIDSTNPINYHHYTKLIGEQRVKEHNKDFIIVRPGWLFGGTLDHKKNFVEARRKEASGNPVLKSAIDKFGSPTYTADISKQIFKLLDANLYGTFNIVNEGRASRYDYVSEIIKQLGLDNSIQQVSSNEFPRKANMPDNEVLENYNLKAHNICVMRNWKEALKDYIENTY